MELLLEQKEVSYIKAKKLLGMSIISLLISWVLGAVITSIFYKRGKWKN